MGKQKSPNDLVSMRVKRKHRDKFKSDAARANQTIYQRFAELV
jgi:hypothetical protein